VAILLLLEPTSSRIFLSSLHEGRYKMSWSDYMDRAGWIEYIIQGEITGAEAGRLIEAKLAIRDQEIERLKAENAELVKAARRMARTHHDTCSTELIKGYACDCGKAQVDYALVTLDSALSPAAPEGGK
jgi:hypothetical protein